MELCAASDPYCAFRNVFWPVRGNAGKPNWSATHSAVIQSGSLSMNQEAMFCVALKPSNAASGNRFSQYAIGAMLSGSPDALAASISCRAAVK